MYCAGIFLIFIKKLYFMCFYNYISNIQQSINHFYLLFQLVYDHNIKMQNHFSISSVKNGRYNIYAKKYVYVSLALHIPLATNTTSRTTFKKEKEIPHWMDSFSCHNKGFNVIYLYPPTCLPLYMRTEWIYSEISGNNNQIQSNKINKFPYSENYGVGPIMAWPYMGARVQLSIPNNTTGIRTSGLTFYMPAAYRWKFELFSEQ